MAAVEQPAPTLTGGPSIQGMVCADLASLSTPDARQVEADMRAREQVGVARYGTPLQAGNGRDAVRDAYEEALDGCAYLRQALEETRGERVHGLLHVSYVRAITLALSLRRAIDVRDGGPDVAV